MSGSDGKGFDGFSSIISLAPLASSSETSSFKRVALEKTCRASLELKSPLSLMMRQILEAQGLLAASLATIAIFD